MLTRVVFMCLPLQNLSNSMKDHLRLHFTSQEASDDKVLRGFPTTIRRRVLRHLYLQSLERCWLFHGCKQKFKDALLAAAKVGRGGGGTVWGA
jgi:hypothetical protein